MNNDIVTLLIIAFLIWKLTEKPQQVATAQLSPLTDSKPLQNEETWEWVDWNGRARTMKVNRRLHD
jgi:hypothetical protein